MIVILVEFLWYLNFLKYVESKEKIITLAIQQKVKMYTTTFYNTFFYFFFSQEDRDCIVV